jgi:hypothetical protein
MAGFGLDLKKQSPQLSAGIKARYGHGIMPPLSLSIGGNTIKLY